MRKAIEWGYLMYNGIINIYKEAGFTSHDVVAKMRGILHQKKIGHTGTLDPQATGVLPVCLGSGTKLCEMLTDKSKEYVAEFILGMETDTQDTTGTVLKTVAVVCTPMQVRQTVEGFCGEYDQIPPMYSALKVNGKKLYELARAGKEVERKARRVTIKEIELLSMELPKVKIRVACSKGTYIRTLCSDIGTELGCGATMDKLVRTRVGQFELEKAITLSELEGYRDRNRIEDVLVAVDQVFSEYPALHPAKEWERLLENGNSLLPAQIEESVLPEAGRQVRLYRCDESFAGVYVYDAQRERYQPVKMFLDR